MNWLQMSKLIILANYFLQLFSDSDKTDLEKDIEDLENKLLDISNFVANAKT